MTKLINIEHLNKSWDLVVIGGGVTGAGVFLEAVNRGWRVLLVERNDFAWGTSSRSSKMVHGGLRYLKEGKLMLTRAAVKERERLLRELPGLVDPLGFLMPIFSDFGPSKIIMGSGLSLYSLMALEKQHRHYSAKKIIEQIPPVRTDHLVGGFYFKDAQVDDARLVLRLIQQGVAGGGCAINYATVKTINRNSRGQVAGLVVEDTDTCESVELETKAIVNATGAWAESLHPSPERGLHLRPLRGSHLIFPKELFPVGQVVSFLHPQDKRPVFMFPWEGCALLGTTDIDHNDNINTDPAISSEETAYLMAGLDFIMPGLNLSTADCISTIAGVRPVLSKGTASASAESREHVVWKDNGLITVTGGKLTTFRLLAGDALKAARQWLPSAKQMKTGRPDFDILPPASPKMAGLPPDTRRRLRGRYGPAAEKLIDLATDDDLLTPIFGTDTIWAELAFAAGQEQVKHLADLLLRRVRIGLLCPEGGQAHLNKIKAICQPQLGWDDTRWELEQNEYLQIWQRFYAPPAG